MLTLYTAVSPKPFNSIRKIISRKFKINLLIKMFAIFVALAILPTIILGIFFYSKANKSIEKEIYEINTKSLDLVKKNIDAVLIDIENEILNTALNPKVVELTSNFGVLEKKLLQLADVGKMIANSVISNDLIHSIYIYIEGNKKILTNSGYSEIENFEIFNEIESLLKSNIQSDILLSTLSDGNSNSTEVLSFLRRFPMSRASSYGVIVYNIKISMLKEILTQNSYVEGMVLAVVDSDGSVLFSSAASGELNKIVDKNIELSQLINSKTDRLIYDNNYLSMMNSDYKPWSYIAFIPKEYINNRLAPIKNTIVTICTFLAFIGLFISYILSKFMYKPINQLVNYLKYEFLKNNPNAQHLEANNEISFINETVRQFIRRGNSAEKLLYNNKQAIKNNLFKSLREGITLDEEKLKDNLDYLNIRFLQENFIVLLASIDRNNYTYEDDNFLDRYSIISLIENSINIEDISIIGIDVGGRTICFIINCVQEKDYATPNRVANEIIEIVKNNFNFSVTIGLGCYVSSLEQLKDSFKCAEQALLYRMFVGFNKVINYIDINTNDDRLYLFQFVKIEQIINNIKVCNKERTLELLEEIFEDISVNLKLSVQNARYVLIHLLSLTIKEVMDNSIIQKKSLDSNFNPYAELEKKETINEIKAWMVDLYTEILDAMKEKRQEQEENDSIVHNAIKYIEKNYPQQISLTDVAEILNISPQYLSAKFKEFTGETFVEFLNKIRLIHAKNLLSNRDMTIYEVAKEVGYNNYQYFIKKFKNVYGVTPAKYRDNIST